MSEPARVRRIDPVLIAILALAFVVRAAAVAWLSDTVPHSDGAYYHLAAQKFLADWRFPFDRAQVEYFGKLGWWPPLYPAFMTLVYRFAGVDPRAVSWVQVALGTAVCAFVYAIGRRAAGRRAAQVAALLVAINPTYVFLTNIIASENLYVFWLAAGLWLAGLPWARRRVPVSAGIVFGLGALTRAVGVAVPVVLALARRRQYTTRRAWWIASAWMVGASALTIAPWTLRNALVAGSPALVCFGGGLNFYFGHNHVALGYRDLKDTPMSQLTTQAAIDREGYRLGLEYLGRNPLGFITRGVRKVGALFGSPGYAPHENSAIMLPEGWNTDPERGRIAAELRARQRAKNRWLDGLFTTWGAVHSWFLLAGGAAAVWLGRKTLPPDLVSAVWLTGYWIAAHAVFWAQPRFRYPLEIPLALLTAFAVQHLRARPPQPRRSR